VFRKEDRKLDRHCFTKYWLPSISKAKYSSTLEKKIVKQSAINDINHNEEPQEEIIHQSSLYADAI